MSASTIFITAVLCGSTVLTTNVTNDINNVIAINHASSFKTTSKKYVLLDKTNQENLSNIELYSVFNNVLSIYYPKGDIKMQMLSIDTIKYDDSYLAFKNNYFIPYYIKNGYYYADDNTLEIFCCGTSLEDLTNEIKESLLISWKLYVDCDESELSGDAKSLRQELTGRLHLVS